jgi:hypothetical protein
MPSRTGSLVVGMSSEPNPETARRPRRLGLFLLGLLFALPSLADQYDYMDRGDRSEGVRGKLVSGDNIELISVRAAPVGGSAGAVPERMRLSFYLPEKGPVHITVRELDYRYYYWMDKVRPPKPWQPGKTNSFRWPTGDVLLWLYDRGLRPDELGAVVRLSGTAAPSAEEQVAPAVLSASDLPVAPQSYLFTFKTNVPARLDCKLYPAASRSAVWFRNFKDVRAALPFTCQVPFSLLRRGDYRLVVDGYSLDTNAPVWEEVRFFHSPELK